MDEAAQDRELLATAVLRGEATPEQVDMFDRLHRSDESFRALVSEIRDFLSPLSGDRAEPAPDPELIETIMAAIDNDPSGETVVTMRGHPKTSPEPWRTIAVISSMAAAVAIGLLLTPSQATDPSQNQFVALLSDETAPPIVAIIYDVEAQTIIAQLSNTAPPSDGVWELWLIRDSAPAPLSLGLLEAGEKGSVSLDLDDELVTGTDTLAVSLEPDGGAPSGQPTGPILFTGKVGDI